jgi:hypothetical protein
VPKEYVKESPVLRISNAGGSVSPKDLLNTPSRCNSFKPGPSSPKDWLKLATFQQEVRNTRKAGGSVPRA